jgi:hypothetical protein
MYYDDFDYEEPQSIPARALADSIRCCTSTYPHSSVPSWLDASTSEYKKLVQLHSKTDKNGKIDTATGKAEVFKMQRAFLAGDTDVLGTRWCGWCRYRCLLVNAGAKLGWPDLFEIYALPETRGVVGQEAWLRVAREASDVLVIEAVRIMEKRAMVARQEIDPQVQRRDAA